MLDFEEYTFTPVLDQRYNLHDDVPLSKDIKIGDPAVVYLADDLKEQTKAVVKMFRSGYIDYKEEMRIMQLVNQHPSCIKMIEKQTDGVLVKPSGKAIRDINYIAMEYIDGGDLFDFLKDNFGQRGMGESFARLVMRDVLCSLEYIHSKGVVHRDVKLENLLVDEQMGVKLIDFGFATDRNIEVLTQPLGTRQYY